MAEKLNILVVDDKRVIGDLFEFTLGHRGHRVVYCDQARLACEAVKREDFDIAFIDVVMPGIEGEDVYKTINKIAPNLPIVIMSGYSVDDKRKEAIEMGAVACLKKPFEMDEAIKIIKGIFGKEI